MPCFHFGISSVSCPCAFLLLYASLSLELKILALVWYASYNHDHCRRILCQLRCQDFGPRHLLPTLQKPPARQSMPNKPASFEFNINSISMPYSPIYFYPHRPPLHVRALPKPQRGFKTPHGSNIDEKTSHDCQGPNHAVPGIDAPAIRNININMPLLKDAKQIYLSGDWSWHMSQHPLWGHVPVTHATRTISGSASTST